MSLRDPAQSAREMGLSLVIAAVGAENPLDELIDALELVGVDQAGRGFGMK